MQALDKKKHHSMIRAIKVYEEHSILCKEIVAQEQDEVIRENIAQFRGTYDYYHLLLKELEHCIEDYRTLHTSLQQMVYPCARKINGQLQRSRSF